MIAKNCAGVVPTPGVFTDADKAMLDAADALIGKARGAMSDFAIHAVLGEAWAVVADANRYFAAQEPWVLRKTDPARMATVLYVTAEVLRQVAILAQPAIPAAAVRLLDILAVAPDARDFAHMGAAHRMVPGTPLPPPQAIFPRYVEPEATAETA
jgi:methionyl-tRNA synthetase